MRQKFVISRSNIKNKLTIKEYAIIDNIPKNAVLFKVQKERYTLLGQETYDSEIIKRHLTEGKSELVSILRTNNLFPIGSYANKIAESVIELYKLKKDHSAELLFNDMDLLPAIWVK